VPQVVQSHPGQAVTLHQTREPQAKSIWAPSRAPTIEDDRIVSASEPQAVETLFLLAGMSPESFEGKRGQHDRSATGRGLWLLKAYFDALLL
jgi:hypothetical protein